MDKKQNALDTIFNDDPLGLLTVKKRVTIKTTDQRLVDSFEEINKFISDNGRVPNDDMSNITEFELYARLSGLKENPEKIEQLKEFDIHNLLPVREISMVAEPRATYTKSVKPKEIESIDDIFDFDDLNILGGDDAGLFDLKHVKKETERSETDFVARRKHCKDFDKYEHLFKQVHTELREGSRKITPFNITTFQEKQYYIHNGIVFYLEEINMDRDDHYKDDGTRVRRDGRTRCIFENGTESNMLMRSVEKMLYNNGKAITENSETAREDFLKNFGIFNSEDEFGGYIYVLKSKSKDNSIASIKDLHKVGFCSTTVEQRINDAHKQPTYLMAPVNYITSWKCANMDANTFEGLLHKLFGQVCLNVDVKDNEGKTHKPREWFIVPLEVIEQAVELIITDEIVHYKYDHQLKNLVLI